MATLSFAEDRVGLGKTPENAWLQRFHDGEPRTLAELYRDHFTTVDRAVSRFAQTVDRETIVHEVFFQLVSRPELRRAFRGGQLGPWLSTVARNQAIDYWRRQRVEQNALSEMARSDGLEHERAEGAIDEQAHRRRLVEEVLSEIPEKWHALFEARFVRQLSQRDAANLLGLHRTTLAYQELRIRKLLRRWASRVEA